jgi:hypothetical protein
MSKIVDVEGCGCSDVALAVYTLEKLFVSILTLDSWSRQLLSVTAVLLLLYWLLLAKYPDNYYYNKLDDDVEVIICSQKHKDNDNWKIALRIKWFQKDTMVPSSIGTSWSDTTQIDLRRQIYSFRCKHCQKYCQRGRYELHHVHYRFNRTLEYSKSMADHVNSTHLLALALLPM